MERYKFLVKQIKEAKMWYNIHPGWYWFTTLAIRKDLATALKYDLGYFSYYQF